MAVTLWEDKGSLRASEQKANQIRKESADNVGQEIVSVERYEVVYQPEDTLQQIGQTSSGEETG
jgi:nickel-dependent lactate racemase